MGSRLVKTASPARCPCGALASGWLSGGFRLFNWGGRRFGRGLQQRRRVVGDAVDRGRHFVDFEQVFGCRCNQCFRDLSINLAAVEPHIESLRRDDRRHPVVNRGASLIGSGRDDRGGFLLFAVGTGPGFPKAGERHWTAGLRPDEIGPLAAALLFPFVEAVGRKQAAAAAHGGTKGRLVDDRFTARVYQQRKCARVLDPGRDQAPAHQRELPLAFGKPHNRHGLGRRDIVTRRKIRLLEIAEQPPDRLGRARDHIASAHIVGPPSDFLSNPLTNTDKDGVVS